MAGVPTGTAGSPGKHIRPISKELRGIDAVILPTKFNICAILELETANPAMSQLNEAIARYHRILESEPYRDLSWVKELQQRMEAEQLSSGGRLLCPVLRPNFVTQRQYDALVKAGEALLSANYRMQQIALSSPRLLAKLELLPAEKMLALIDPGYASPDVLSKLDLQVSNGSLRLTQANGDAPAGAAYAENLGEIFFDSPPLKEFRRKYNVTKTGGKKPFLTALLEAYRQFTESTNAHHATARASNGQKNGNGHHGKQRPNIAFVEFRQTTRRSEFELFRDYFRTQGFRTEVVAPEQLEYRNGKLRSGDFEIDLVYRRFSVQEFLVRFTLNHPLLEAYRERKICVVNSFRSEMSHKRAMLALLTDESLTAKFPANERRAIREHVPWTRVVTAGKTMHGEEQVELLDFIRDHRETLLLRPNDESSDLPMFVGREIEQADWEKALRHAQRSPYVVQERVEPARLLFPLLSYGHLEFREMNVDVHPQAALGKVTGCSTFLSASSNGGFSTSAGIAPTFIIDAKS